MYHESCPVCGVRFIGATDADLVKHFIEERHEQSLAGALGAPPKKRITCEDCGRQYTTYMGDCPWCRHDGPPYE